MDTQEKKIGSTIKSSLTVASLILLVLSTLTLGCIGQPEAKGGTLIIGTNADPATQDPSFTTGVLAATTGLGLVHDNLVDLDLNFEPVPNLAKSWEQMNDEGTHWRFELQEGVKYHDGTDFNAEAAQYSFNRYMTLESPHRELYADFDRVEVVDDYTIDIYLKGPYVDFFPTLATNTGMLSKSAVEEWGDEDYGLHPIGTGPFKLTEWVHNDHMTFTAFEDYWNGRPNSDEVIIKFIPDDTVRMLNLETGAIHISDIPPNQIKRMSTVDTVTLHEGASSTYELIVLNNEVAPFDNILVRRALNYAVDREAISEIVTDGYAPPAKGPMFPGTPFWDENLEAYDYDPQRARDLLAEAGYPTGFEVTMDVATIVVDWAEVVQQQLAEVGVIVTLQQWEWGPFIQKLLGRDYNMVIVGWGGHGPTPLAILEPWYHSHNIKAGGFNVQNINDTYLDGLLDDLRVAMDIETSLPIIQEIQQRVIDQAYSVILAYNPRYFGVTEDVVGYEVHPHWLYGHVIAAKSFNIDVYVMTKEEE